MHDASVRCTKFDQKWSTVELEPLPTQIATAGLFILGERDCVKCWFCNLSLEPLKIAVSLWHEHANGGLLRVLIGDKRHRFR